MGIKSLRSMTRRTIVAGIIAAVGVVVLGVSASYATHAGPSTVCDGEAPEFTVGGLTPDFSPAAVLVGGVQVGTLPNDMGDHQYTAPAGTPNTFTVVVASPPNDKHADTFVKEFPMTAVAGNCVTTTTPTPTIDTHGVGTSTTETATTETATTETATTQTATTQTATTETQPTELCPVVVAGRGLAGHAAALSPDGGRDVHDPGPHDHPLAPTTIGIAESQTTSQVVVTLPQTGSDVRHTAWLPVAGAAGVAARAVLQLTARRRKAA